VAASSLTPGSPALGDATLNSGTTPLISAERPATGSLCAGDYNSSKTSGTNADLETCNGGTGGQSLTIPKTTGQIKTEGLCLAVIACA
jgi:hypothetical protein